MAGRIRSAQETLRYLLQREPRLSAYLDQVSQLLRTTSWELRMAGENVDLLYTKIWPPIELEREPVHIIGRVSGSPLDAGYPRKRTGRPRASWEEEDEE